MDAKKALFRAKLREATQKREKRIDSPLVRYNEYDQPVCKICNVTLKSESLWPAHQVSKKHREAVENVKTLAAGRDNRSLQLEKQKETEKPQPSSIVPSNFVDKRETSRKRGGAEESSTSEVGIASSKNEEAKKISSSESKHIKGQLPDGFFDQESDEMIQPSKKAKGILLVDFFDGGGTISGKEISGQPNDISSKAEGTEVKQVKGALPAGFFDNKDADLRARGIQPVKIDVNDAYKEFEKEIQEDLLEVDDRLEEEEIDAAEARQEFELLEQREYRERVEMVKKKLVEAKSLKNARGQKRPAFVREASSDESSTDEEESTFAVDWRAQHL
ncbi:zinc ion binding protein [Wolffia australiana]